MKNIVGYAVKQVRKEKRITQGELSKLTGFGQSTISNHENGNRALDEIDIQVYSKALNVPPQYFFDIAHGNNVSQKNIVNGDNRGMNGDNNGTVNINNGSKNADKHQEEAQEMRSDDLEVQEAILERFDKQLAVQHETNKKLDKIINLLSKKEK